MRILYLASPPFRILINPFSTCLFVTTLLQLISLPQSCDLALFVDPPARHGRLPELSLIPLM
jgi:hypothetical protein